MASQPSPSPPSPSCGRAVAYPQGTGCQEWGVLEGTGWWSSCAGRSVAAQPSERWTWTEKEKHQSQSLFYVTTWISASHSGLRYNKGLE